MKHVQTSKMDGKSPIHEGTPLLVQLGFEAKAIPPGSMPVAAALGSMNLTAQGSTNQLFDFVGKVNVGRSVHDRHDQLFWQRGKLCNFLQCILAVINHLLFILPIFCMFPQTTWHSSHGLHVRTSLHRKQGMIWKVFFLSRKPLLLRPASGLMGFCHTNLLHETVWILLNHFKFIWSKDARFFCSWADDMPASSIAPA